MGTGADQELFLVRVLCFVRDEEITSREQERRNIQVPLGLCIIRGILFLNSELNKGITDWRLKYETLIPITYRKVSKISKGDNI
jgi:hypothetical protein